jgi:hypothetical protein
MRAGNSDRDSGVSLAFELTQNTGRRFRRRYCRPPGRGLFAASDTDWGAARVSSLLTMTRRSAGHSVSLARLGFEAQEANTGAQALALLGVEYYNVVLLDIGIGGIAFWRQTVADYRNHICATACAPRRCGAL